jgi:hypothetical protein
MTTFLTETYCIVDDFCKIFEKERTQNFLPTNKRNRKSRMSLAEIVTIELMFHESRYRDFKNFYMKEVLKSWKKEFPKAVCYSRFVQMMKYTCIPLIILMKGIKVKKTGTYYVDSTPLEVCHIKRERNHRVFKGDAKKSKTTKGWI